jgi:type 1 glutamine amidotransferase
MRKVIFFLVVSWLCFSAKPFEIYSAEADSEKIKVLILTGSNNHNWEQTTPFIEKLLKKHNDLFQVDIDADPINISPASFQHYDVILNNWNVWPDTLSPWNREIQNAFMNFIRSGGGLVTFHGANASHYDWDEYQQLIGATWGLGQTGHGPVHTFRVQPDTKIHPVTRGMKSFYITDELWHDMRIQPGAEKLGYAYSSMDSGGTGEMEPVMFWTTLEKGRCFNLVLGHDLQALENINWQTLLLRGTEWAATGKVTIPVPEDQGKQHGPEVSSEPDYTWWQTEHSVALLNHGRVVWQLNFLQEEGKPFFHPLSLSDGTELTWLRPQDHPWHRALWFSWKYINGINYWEEDETTGLSEGRSTIANVEISLQDDYSATCVLEIQYHPLGEPVVLKEKRALQIYQPEDNGSYYIDWESDFQALERCALERTPIVGEENGVSWGGYAGLSLRLARTTSDWTALNSNGEQDLDSNQKRANWLQYTFDLPGDKSGGITVFDHPDNRRHPTPWYVIMDEQVPFGYFSPAMLYYEPLTLKKNERLTLKYRIIVHEAGLTEEELQTGWRAFTDK